MATATELFEAVVMIDALRAKVADIQTSTELQAELDGVNARLEQERNEKTIVKQILADEELSDADKLAQIAQTLEPLE